MATIPEALALAVRYHQAGNLQQAEFALPPDPAGGPQQCPWLHLLGVIAHQVGKHDLAIQNIGQAIRLRPSEPAFHNNLGLALKAQGRLAEAVTQYQEALCLRPDYVEAHNNQGAALQDQGQLAEAMTQYQEAIRLKPDFAEIALQPGQCPQKARPVGGSGGAVSRGHLP